MIRIVRVSDSEFFNSGEMRFNLVQPGSVSWEKFQEYVIISTPVFYFFFNVRAKIVKDNIEFFCKDRPNVFEES